MKSIVTLIGIILIIFGIFTFSYQHFTYTTDEKVAEIGNVQVTAQNEKTVSFPPMLAGLSLAAGVILVIVGMKKKM